MWLVVTLTRGVVESVNLEHVHVIRSWGCFGPQSPCLKDGEQVRVQFLTDLRYAQWGRIIYSYPSGLVSLCEKRGFFSHGGTKYFVYERSICCPVFLPLLIVEAAVGSGKRALQMCNHTLLLPGIWALFTSRHMLIFVLIVWRRDYREFAKDLQRLQDRKYLGESCAGTVPATSRLTGQRKKSWKRCKWLLGKWLRSGSFSRGALSKLQAGAEGLAGKIFHSASTSAKFMQMGS